VVFGAVDKFGLVVFLMPPIPYLPFPPLFFISHPFVKQQILKMFLKISDCNLAILAHF